MIKATEVSLVCKAKEVIKAPPDREVLMVFQVHKEYRDRWVEKAIKATKVHQVLKVLKELKEIKDLGVGLD